MLRNGISVRWWCLLIPARGWGGGKDRQIFVCNPGQSCLHNNFQEIHSYRDTLFQSPPQKKNDISMSLSLRTKPAFIFLLTLCTVYRYH